ncbi:hypothetical protein J6590_106167, partial [Homalodisca vitripennis]
MMTSEPGVVISPGVQNRLNKGRKRKMKINQWKETNRKRARDAGNPYISKRKKPVPGKLPPEMGIQCSCKFQCSQLNHEEILQHFNNFHGLSYNSQTAFLANSSIKVVDINRHT